MEPIQAKDLSGSYVALVTPMNEDGSINLAQWQTLLNWHVNCGTAGVVVAGTTGESVSLKVTEVAQLIKSAVDTCRDTNTKVLVGTGAIDPETVIQANQQAYDLGAHAVLVVTPYYLSLSQKALIEHYRFIASASRLPIILYNVPKRTGTDLLAESTAQLAKIPNIIGIKEAKSDMGRIQKLLKIKNFAVLSGDDHSFVTAMKLGAHGVISVAANVRPKTIVKLCNLVQFGDLSEADQLNEKTSDLYDFLFHEPNPCPVKAMMHAAEIINQGIRKPLLLTQLNTTYINQHMLFIKQEFSPL